MFDNSSNVRNAYMNISLVGQRDAPLSRGTQSMPGRKVLSAAIGMLLAGTVVAAADTIKVGIIGPFSGPFALQGKNFQAGVEAYVATNGKSVKGHDVEIVYRDLPAANPQQSRAL